MSAFKCKMCGGDLTILEGETVAECEYCGSRQTVPTADNEKKMTLFGRANRLRLACDFDKAAGIYENIVAEFPEEAEAYWGLVLCKYGIEYVDDPATAKKLPTCHRSSFDSVMEDSDFEQACENADGVARRVYRDEAKAIEELRKGILEVSGKEEPYDIFICYKETDENGERTLDSVLAQDTYDALVDKGYRVFFSRITLEDKLGQEYEPYIFAALNSAKVMLAFGTDYEYYNAVWVKNEWSRYLKLMASDKEKHLIPCYKNIDAYDMPKEFAKLQAQDMGKVGAQQDLLRGIDKLIAGNNDEPNETAREKLAVQQNVGPSVGSLLKRGTLFLEDEEWDSSTEYFDKVLDINPECAEAYLGKVLAKSECRKMEKLVDVILKLQDDPDYLKAMRFGSEELKQQITVVYDTARKAEQSRIEEEKKARDESKTRCAKCRKRILPVQGSIASGWNQTFGLQSDGTVVATKYTGSPEKYYSEGDVSDWRNVVAISGSCSHVAGLRSDGTVVAMRHIGIKEEYCGGCDVSSWKDIEAISTGEDHTIGLRSDGTVVATKYTGDPEEYSGNCDVSDWRDIVAISAGTYHSAGLRSDGTVVATKYTGDPKYYFGECDVSDWRDIVAISSGTSHTVGLRSDGTVVATKYTGIPELYCGECDVDGWRDIVAISAGFEHTVGLRSDGTVVATKYIGTMQEYQGECDVADWRDIVAISADSRCTVGLRSDGTVVAVGENRSGKCNVDAWNLFNSLDTLEVDSEKARVERQARDEREAAEKKAQEEIEAAERKAKEKREAAEKKAQEEARKDREEQEAAARKVREEQEAAERKAREEREAAERKAREEQQAQWRAQGLCQNCGGQLKGLFTKKCVKCGKPKDY